MHNVVLKIILDYKFTVIGLEKVLSLSVWKL